MSETAKASSDPVIVKLDFPVEVGGQKYETLTMRRAKVLDRRMAMKVNGTDADKEARLFTSLCEVPPEVIDALDEIDYLKLQDAYVSFRGPAK